MKTKNTIRLAALLMLAAVSNLTAQITLETLGAVAPPLILHGNSMVPFDPVAGSPVSEVPLPSGVGVLSFGTELTRYTVGDTWGTWSHVYTGDVYLFEENPLADPSDPPASLTLNLPSNTSAFYFYVQPNFLAGLGIFDITAANAIGSPITGVSIEGDGGAKGFAVYTTDPILYPITTVTVTGTNTWPDGFAIGEFGINGQPAGPSVPDGGSSVLMLAGASLALLAARRRLTR